MKLDEPAASAVALLALAAGQDVEPAEDRTGPMGGGGSPARSPKTGLISTVDPQARHTRKSPEARRDGYRAPHGGRPGDRDHYR